MTERRGYERRALFKIVIIQSLESGQVWQCSGYDISREGISVRSKEKFNSKHTYIITVNLGYSVFSAECLVVNHSKYGEKGFRAGFKLVDASFESQQALKRFLK